MASKCTAEIRKEGRITLPKSVRRKHELEPGDFVILEVQPIEESSQ